LDELLDAFPETRAIGLTGQMHGILYVDGDGLAVSPLYTWQDGRAGRGTPSVCERLAEATGYRLAPGYGLATHAALQQQGAVPSQAKGLCTVMDYAAARLCGCARPVIHATNAASLGLFDLAGGCFDGAALKAAGLSTDLLPAIVPDGTVLGTYRGCAVCVAVGDNQASFLGSVCDPAIQALANFGTGSQISLAVEGELPAVSGSMELRPLSGNGTLLCGAALCGGRAYALLESFFRRYAVACGLPDEAQYGVMERLAEQGMDGAFPLAVRTTFCGTREDGTLRGTVEGLGEENFSPEALTAGVLRGMAAELRALYDRMPHGSVRELVASGNAVRKNPMLRRALEECFGLPVRLPVQKEEAALGAALCAAEACGLGGDPLRSRAIRYE
jgi:sedoheptulokinase